MLFQPLPGVSVPQSPSIVKDVDFFLSWIYLILAYPIQGSINLHHSDRDNVSRLFDHWSSAWVLWVSYLWPVINNINRFNRGVGVFVYCGILGGASNRRPGVQSVCGLCKFSWRVCNEPRPLLAQAKCALVALIPTYWSLYRIHWQWIPIHMPRHLVTSDIGSASKNLWMIAMLIIIPLITSGIITCSVLTFGWCLVSDV
jgi:hypothetical protein